jgi:hypothetical protein
LRGPSRGHRSARRNVRPPAGARRGPVHSWWTGLRRSREQVIRMAGKKSKKKKDKKGKKKK